MKVHWLDRIGSAGALLAAIAAPCCFPLFAAIGTAAGLSALGEYEGIILYIFQLFALLTLAGLVLFFPKHGAAGPVLIGFIASLALAYHFYWRFSLAALYSGLFGLIAASIWNYWAERQSWRPVLQSTITCPECGRWTEETMPTNACLYFFDCPGCGATLKPRKGDCCVFCSYGSVACPPIQMGDACCSQ